MPIAHTPAYLRDSQTTGRMHPMKLALPDDCARLKKIVASVINVDKDAGFYTAAYGPIQTWNSYLDEPHVPACEAKRTSAELGSIGMGHIKRKKHENDAGAITRSSQSHRVWIMGH